MNQLKCEVCGSHDILKQEDFFVCQYCGCKYTAERMREQIQEIKGTVKVEEPVQTVQGDAERERLRNVAKQYFELNDYYKAEQICKKIVEDYPDDYKSWRNLALIPMLYRQSFDYRKIGQYLRNAERLAPQDYLPRITQMKNGYLSKIQDGSIIANVIDEDFCNTFGDGLKRTAVENARKLNEILQKYPFRIQEEVTSETVRGGNRYIKFYAYIGNSVCWKDCFDNDMHCSRISIKPEKMGDIDAYAKKRNNQYIDENKCPSCADAHGKHSELGLFGKCKQCKEKPKRF